jgi:DNA-binding transcriptional regulator of glucitol operon
MSDDIRDELPEDLDAAGFVGAYTFPDNSRRRIPAFLYLACAALCLLAWWRSSDSSSGLVNEGFAWAALLFGAFAVYGLSSSWKMTVDEREALLLATQAVGFAVGHASAQQVWRGMRSRPTWRVLCYSAEEPPLQRGLVLVDAINKRTIECLVEDNPEVTA